MTRHVDVERPRSIADLRQHGQRFLAVTSEAKGVLISASLAAEAPLQQHLEVELVVGRPADGYRRCLLMGVDRKSSIFGMQFVRA